MTWPLPNQNLTIKQFACNIIIYTISYIIGGSNLTQDYETKLNKIINDNYQSFDRGEVFGINAILQPILDELIIPAYVLDDIDRDRIINGLFAGIYLIRNIGGSQ